jgi:twitching motility protein PilT
MKSQDLVAGFRAANWPTPVDAQRYVRDAGVVPPPDVEKLLEAMRAPDIVADEQTHESRRSVLDAILGASLKPELFRVLTRELPQQDPETQRLLARFIPRVNDSAHPEELVAILRSPSKHARLVGAEVMGQLGGPTLFNAVADALKEPGFVGLREAFDSLVVMGGPRALAPILQACTRGDTLAKVQALDYLATLYVEPPRVPEVLAALRTLFNDPSDEVVVRAIDVYGKRCTEEDFFKTLIGGINSPRTEVVKAVVGALRNFPVQRSMDALDWRFKSGNRVIRMAVLDTLEAMANPVTVPLLAEALAVPHILVRRRAAEILVHLGNAAKVDIRRTVLWLMKSPDVNVRRMALSVAREVDDPRDQVWPELLGHLADPDWWVRESLVDVIVQLAKTRLRGKLQPLVGAASPVFRLYAVALVERLADPEMLPLLQDLIARDPDAIVRERAVEALGKIKHPNAVATLLQVMRTEPEFQVTCLEALEKLNARATAVDVASLLQGPDPAVRLAAVKCLQALDDPRQTPWVQAIVNDPDERVARAGRVLLDRWRSYEVTAAQPTEDNALDQLLLQAQQRGDLLILAANACPVVRDTRSASRLLDEPISADALNKMVLPVLNSVQMQRLRDLEEVEFSYELKERGERLRVHLFRQAAGYTAVIRLRQGTQMALKDLGLPELVSSFVAHRNGLVLVGGPPHSGKSTTANALVDLVNQESMRHVIMLQSSLEVVHTPVRSVLTQREVGLHVKSLDLALRGCLRQDPDVIVIDDLRDFATTSFALTAAGTGHLVIGCIVAPSAQAALERIILSYPSSQTDFVQSMLADSLRAAVVQRLVPRADGLGQVPVADLLVNTSGIAGALRKGRANTVSGTMATSADAGMQLMENDLQLKVRAGVAAP